MKKMAILIHHNIMFSYVANGPPTAGWYGAHDPRLSKLNFYATFQ